MDHTMRNYRMDKILSMDVERFMEYLILGKELEAVATHRRLFECTLREVEKIKELLTIDGVESLCKALSMLEGVDPNEILKYRYKEFFGKVNDLSHQLEELRRAELNGLSSKYKNEKFEQVGGPERLAPLGVYTTLEKLSKGDITKWDQILDMPYHIVFAKLRMDTILGDIEFEMSKVKDNAQIFR